MKIGILTSGGDCPGLNAVIRGIVLKGIAIHGHEFVGFLDGWRGVVEGDIIAIPRTLVRGIAKDPTSSKPTWTGWGSTPSSPSAAKEPSRRPSASLMPA
jgi:hypothetical protein